MPRFPHLWPVCRAARGPRARHKCYRPAWNALRLHLAWTQRLQLFPRCRPGAKAAHAAWREFSFHRARPGVGDSGATYLGGELDSVHGVLGAVVVRGAPVQVELAEPVGPAERPAPQHCAGRGGVSAPCPCPDPDGAPRAKVTPRGPSLRTKAGRAGLPHRTKSLDEGERMVSPFCLIRLLVLLLSKRHVCENKRRRAGGQLGCRQTTCGPAAGCSGRNAGDEGL